MRILLVIRKAMVSAVDGNPKARRKLQTTGSEDGKAMLEPKRARETAMCYQPMKTKIDAEKAEDIYPATRTTTPVQLKNQGTSAKAASE